jgi:hypothetical protein
MRTKLDAARLEVAGYSRGEILTFVAQSWSVEERNRAFEGVLA